MTWTHVSETDRAGAMSARVLTPDQQDAVNDVLDASAEWRAGRMPWEVAASIGGWHSPERTRALAIGTTPRTDPRWHDLMALLDVLIDASGWVRTRQGVFSRRELGERDVIVHLSQKDLAA